MAIPAPKGTFTPTIRCSNCGREVGLDVLTEHVCSDVSAVQRAPPEVIPFTNSERPLVPPIRDASFLQPRRPMQLPKIDPYAASRPGAYYSGELTPASSGQGSQVVSPRSATSSKAPWPMPTPPSRKISTPAIRGPPSPKLISQDCAFPPFPMMTKSRSNTSDSKGQKSDADSETFRRPSHSKSTASSPRGSIHTTTTKTMSRRASSSSSKSRSRGKTVGSKQEATSRPSAASNMKRRPSLSNLFGFRKTSSEVPPPLPTSTASTTSMPASRKGSVEDIPAPLTAPLAPKPQMQSPIERPWTSDARADPVSSSGSLRNAQLSEQRHTRLGGYDGLALTRLSEVPSIPDLPQRREPVSPKSESTDHVPQIAEEYSFRLSKVEGTGDGLSKEPSYRAKRPAPILSDRNLDSSKSARHSPIYSPNFPFANQDPKTGDDPGGIMDRSQSDETSMLRILASPTAIASSPSNSTPPQYPSSYSPSSLPAGHHAINSIANIRSPRPVPTVNPDVENKIPSAQVFLSSPAEIVPDEKTIHPSRISIDSASSYGSEASVVPSSSSQSSPPRDEIRRDVSDFVLGTQSQSSRSTDLRQPLRPRLPRLQTDSPTDPLFQNGQLSSIPPSPSGPPPSNLRLGQMSAAADHSPKDFSSYHVSTRSKTLGSNKGTCRGCMLIISSGQKSVSSADGRLTGRYHKECFVCRTCRNTFATADFYVFKDQPYCAHHYHELNGTLCTGCGKGIEGQYLESSTSTGQASKKFHPRCLNCATCRCPLRDDYFEFNSRVYCERDAFRIASLPSRSQYDSAPSRPSPLGQGMLSVGDPGMKGRFPERRTTKLMLQQRSVDAF